VHEPPGWQEVAMNTKLSKFDKLMLAITFAEADACEVAPAECGIPAREGRQPKGDKALKNTRQKGPLAGHVLKAGC